MLARFNCSALKHLLIFSQATGLQVNYAKSSLMLVTVSDPQLQMLAETFDCAV
jgi:hypothetical protein